MTNTDKSIVGNSEYKPGYKILSPEEIIEKYSKLEQQGSPNVRKPKTIETKVEESQEESREEKTSFDSQDFIYIPSISLYVAKQRTLLGLNWNQCQEQLHKENSKMLTVPEFKEFLNYTKINFPEIYSEITEVRNSGLKLEWLDAYFDLEDEDLFVYYHVFEKNKIIKKKEKLDEDTLMSRKTPGISLEKWLKKSNSTKQGLPKNNIDSGDLYYWAPIKVNNSAAVRFMNGSNWAGLDCNAGSSDWNVYGGVRVAKLALCFIDD